MIKQLYLYIADGTEPFINQAREKVLLDRVPADCAILYLWRNAHTVVIGRNQDCYDECRVLALEADGGHLARRITGGGAVYHDAGNLNFTFLVRRGDYDVPRQNRVILSAVSRFGVETEVSGRNDLLAAGRKFSGHAYRMGDLGCCHHGTLLINTNADLLAHYLYVKQDKLAGKGIRSVRARVINLSELCPSINAASMQDALIDSFQAEYGLPVHPLPKELLPEQDVERETAFFSDGTWRYGYRLAATDCAERRFPWGSLRLAWIVEDGIIRDAAAYSDAMEWDVVLDLPNRLRGCRADAAAVCAALGDTQIERDAAELLQNAMPACT